MGLRHPGSRNGTTLHQPAQIPGIGATRNYITERRLDYSSTEADFKRRIIELGLR